MHTGGDSGNVELIARVWNRED